MSDCDTAPPRGLPAPLPAGERLLWQGAPQWRSLARHTFHVRGLAIYFALMLAWRAGAGVGGGDSLGAVAKSMLGLGSLAVAAVGLVALLAWLTGRTTIYTITSKRVVMQFGIALPMSVNIPYQIIASAARKPYADGTGDLPLSLTGSGRMAYFHLWPHARPWRIADPQPMLRSVPHAAQVAEILARALASAAGEIAQASRETPADRVARASVEAA